jgi:hypothetical protein
MTEAEVIDRINSTIKKNGKNAITGDEMNFVLKAIIQLIADSGGVINWGDIEGTIADQLDLASALAAKQNSLGYTPENVANKGAANGYTPLNSSSKIDNTYLPSYVDDVIEVANFAALPGTGEVGKIYITLEDNKTYRWSGSAYVEISASLALGETSGSAYRGDRGKIAYDHSQETGNPHGTTATDVDALKRDGSNANSDVDISNYDLNIKGLKIKGTGGNGHLNLKHQSSAASAGGSESVIYADSTGNPKWKNDGNAVQEIALLDTVLAKLGLFIYKQSTPNSAVTGAGELIAGSVPIGSGRLATIDKLIVDSTFVKTTTLGTYTLRYYLAPNSNNLTSAVQIAIASGFAATAVFIPTWPRLFDIESGNLKGFPFSQSAVLPTGTSNPISTTPFNVANTFHFITTVQFTNSSDSGYLNSQLIKNF